MLKEMLTLFLEKRTRKYAFLLVCGLAIISIQLSIILGAETGQETSLFGGNIAFIAAALAVGVSALGGGIAIYGATSAGAAAIAERPETFVYILIFAGLGEGLAIYGLVVAIMILGKI